MDKFLVEEKLLAIISARTLCWWLVVDREGKLIYANDVCLKTWEKTSEDCLGCYLEELLYSGKKLNGSGSYFSPLIETMETGREFSEREFCVDNPVTNLPNWFIANTYLFRDAQGLPEYVAGYYVPIDKFKVLENKLDFISLNIIKSFAKAIGARDKYTMRHVENVSALMLGLAEYMQLPEEETELAYLAAIVHDIGKIGVPENILKKPGRLTTEEFEIMKFHPAVGAEILQEIDGFAAIAHIIRHHHERYDGAGYPDGLSGRHIPMFSRMLAVCDAYDAMTSVRCYRKQPWDEQLALEEITSCSGAQFDPVISKFFVDFVRYHKNIQNFSFSSLSAVQGAATVGNTGQE